MYEKKRRACTYEEQVKLPRVMATRSLGGWEESSDRVGRDKRSRWEKVKREGGGGHQFRDGEHGKVESITKEKRGDGQERLLLGPH